MSTLGDLLAEHTVLPGTAVDHLHTLVGEWQLLADLSFADYLMWVRRDDGALVCVAQVRPNTAPTVLLSDAVGSIAGPGELPLVTAAFASGVIGHEDPDGRPADAVERRVARGQILYDAPEVVIPFLVPEGAHSYPDAARTAAEHTMFTVAVGAAVQGLLVSLAVRGVLERLAEHGYGTVQSVTTANETLVFALPREIRPARG